MSRIGRMPVHIPAGVEVTIGEGNLVTVKGPKGSLTQQLYPTMTLTQEAGVVHVARPNDEKENRALHGLTRALLHNMVVGVTEGYTKSLELVGTGYRAQMQGKALNITIGFSHPVIVDAPENISFETPTQTKIVVKGIDKQQVGNIAADIRAIRKPEPYHGKGIRYENENVRRKEGKTGKK